MTALQNSFERDYGRRHFVTLSDGETNQEPTADD